MRGREGRADRLYLSRGRLRWCCFGGEIEGGCLGLSITVLTGVLVDLLHHLGVRESTVAKFNRLRHSGIW